MPEGFFKNPDELEIDPLPVMVIDPTDAVPLNARTQNA
jgi:hypothetical protein